MKTGLLLMAVAVGISGCTLFDRQEKRINYTENLNSIWGGPTLVTDAKQRAIINVPADVYEGNFTIDEKGKRVPSETGDNGVKNHPTRLICAEPSPDVAQAISAAFTAAAEVDAKLADAAAPGVSQQIAGSGSVGSAYASSIAQLGERLATVALLRDKMYRACEAYQNGAITDTSYTLMLSRFDKTMTSLLSAEMAAGAFGRNLAALGGSASTGGVDPAKMQAAKNAVTQASADLQTAATTAAAETDKTKRDAILAEPKAALEKAVNGLVALEYQTAQAAASSGPGNTTGVIGEIVGRTGTDADAVARINANFLDDDASGSIIDACITALDRNRQNALGPELQAKLNQIEEDVVSVSKEEGAARSQLPAAEQNKSLSDLKLNTVRAPAEGEAVKDVEDAQKKLRGLKEAKRNLIETGAMDNPSLSRTCSTILATANDSATILTVKNDGSGITSEVKGGVIGLLQQNKLALRNVEADIAKVQFAAEKANAEKEKARIEGCMLAAGNNPNAESQAKLWQCLGILPKP